jgi:DNA polymerase-3 subunit delta'
MVSFQDWPVQSGDAARLYQTLERGTIPQAMLLAGDTQVGKTLGRFVGKTLLCTGPEKPCNRCEQCIQFEAGVMPNWYEVNTEEASLKTGHIEELQGFFHYRAHGTGPLVYLIPSLDTATPVAANRLLKTLEEPPASMVAILTARNTRQVLPTIVSRCHVYRLLDPSPGNQTVEEDNPQDPQQNKAAQDSQDPPIAALFDAVVQWTESLLQGSEPPLVLAEQLNKMTPLPSGIGPLDILLEWLHTLMHQSADKATQLRFPQYKQHAVNQAKRVSGPRLAAAVRIVLDAKVRTGSHVMALLNFEQMCIRIRRVVDGLHGSGSPI